MSFVIPATAATNPIRDRGRAGVYLNPYIMHSQKLRTCVDAVYLISQLRTGTGPPSLLAARRWGDDRIVYIYSDKEYSFPAELRHIAESWSMQCRFTSTRGLCPAKVFTSSEGGGRHDQRITEACLHF